MTEKHDVDVKAVLAEMLAEAQAERAKDTKAVIRFQHQFCEWWDEVIEGYLPKNWYTSLRTLYSKGLTFDDMYDAIMITSSTVTRTPFNYFCGVCHTKLRQITEEVETRYQAMVAELDTVVKEIPT
jgi:hypothetical protein